MALEFGVNGALHTHEDDHVRIVLARDGAWYTVNAWARGSKREAWRQVHCGRTSRSYLFALNMFNDHGAVRQAYQDTLNFAA